MAVLVSSLTAEDCIKMRVSLPSYLSSAVEQTALFVSEALKNGAVCKCTTVQKAWKMEVGVFGDRNDIEWVEIREQSLKLCNLLPCFTYFL